MSDVRISVELQKNKGYLSNRTFRKLLKKFQRKRRRTTLALINNQDVSQDEGDAGEDHECLIEYELERERLHKEWLERERLVQIEWEKKEEQRRLCEKEKEIQELKIKEDWEALKRKIEDDLAEKERKLQAEVDKQDRWMKQINEIAEGVVLPDGLDVVESPPEGQAPCPFYSKVAACRFGDRCSRFHAKPVLSDTLLIPHFFSNVKWTVSKDDRNDSGLEFEDSEIYAGFRTFYEDVKPELESYGKLAQLRACSNSEAHLRGHLYIQYQSVQNAARAFLMLHGRFYAGRQLQVQFIRIPEWKSAVCGWYFTRRCVRERNCNFLHVFSNPNDEFSLHRPRQTPSATAPGSVRGSSSRSRRWSTSSSSRSPSPPTCSKRPTTSSERRSQRSELSSKRTDSGNKYHFKSARESEWPRSSRDETDRRSSQSKTRSRQRSRSPEELSSRHGSVIRSSGAERSRTPKRRRRPRSSVSGSPRRKRHSKSSSCTDPEERSKQKRCNRGLVSGKCRSNVSRSQRAERSWTPKRQSPDPKRRRRSSSSSAGSERQVKTKRHSGASKSGERRKQPSSPARNDISHERKSKTKRKKDLEGPRIPSDTVPRSSEERRQSTRESSGSARPSKGAREKDSNCGSKNSIELVRASDLSEVGHADVGQEPDTGRSDKLRDTAHVSPFQTKSRDSTHNYASNEGANGSDSELSDDLEELRNQVLRSYVGAEKVPK